MLTFHKYFSSCSYISIWKLHFSMKASYFFFLKWNGTYCKLMSFLNNHDLLRTPYWWLVNHKYILSWTMGTKDYHIIYLNSAANFDCRGFVCLLPKNVWVFDLNTESSHGSVGVVYSNVGIFTEAKFDTRPYSSLHVLSNEETDPVSD